MLVRILSHVASFLGNARHRAVIVSCLAVLVAGTSVYGILAYHKNQPLEVGAVAGTERTSERSNSVWLHGQQPIEGKDTAKPQEEPTPSDTPVSPPDDAPEPPTEPPTDQPPPTIVASPDMVEIIAGTTSETITARIVASDNDSTKKWTIRPDQFPQNSGLSLVPIKTEDGSLIAFQITASKDTQPGKYELALQIFRAHSDAPHNQTTILTISVSTK